MVAHEVAHLWWGILVGGDSNKHAYIQEGLATVSSLLYVKETLGPEAAAQLAAWVTGPAFESARGGRRRRRRAGRRGDDPAIWSAASYGKGSLGFLAIREEIGAAALSGVARPRHPLRLGRDDPDDLRGAFERASGRDLDALWSHWFDETAMTQEEIEEIAAAFGGQR